MRQKASLGIVGCGDWGKNIVRTSSELGILGAVCDPSLDEIPYGVPLQSFESLLANDSISGIVIASPTPTHFPLAKAALMAGKHVLVEKPLVKTIQENEELIQLSKDQNLHVLSGHLLLYHPAFKEMKKLVEGGEVGDLHTIVTRRANFGKFYAYEDVVWDFSPHDLSMILSLMGELPLRVFASTQTHVYPDLSDIAVLELEFSKNRMAHVYLSRLSSIKEQRITATGNEGMITFDDTLGWESKIKISPLYRNSATGVPEKGETTALSLPASQPLALELQHFMDVIREKKPPKSSGHTALQILKVILAAQESAATGVWVAL